MSKKVIHAIYDDEEILLNSVKSLKSQGIDITEVQWETCDLSDCPPEREPGTISMVNHGKISSCPPEDLPKTFIDTDGNEHKIEDIHSLKSSTW